MSTHKCEVVKIELSEHPNADALSIVPVFGWQCVVRTDEWNDGDLGVYVPPDSVVPDTEEIKRLGGMSGRIRAIRLRQVVSMGLLLHAPDGAEEGDDLMEALGVTHYEPPLPMSSGGEAERGPAGFFPHYDVENYRNSSYGSLISAGEDVVITEKIHGCFKADVRISLPDGRRERIGQLVARDFRGEVLGLDRNGKVTPTRVVGVYKNGLGTEWLKFSFDRRYAGRGSSHGALQCTPDHRIFSVQDNKFIEASALRVGDTVKVIRSEIGLTPVQEQVLIGKLLGDASLRVDEFTASLKFGHKKEHEEYVVWTERALGDICGSRRPDETSGYGTVMVGSRTISNIFVKEMFQDWFETGSKEVPSSIIPRVGPIALAFWYMDDGSLSHNDGQEDRVLLATNSFRRRSIEHLQSALQKFGITSVCYESDGFRLRLNADEAEKFFLLVAPYVPPVMQYKLPERYRGHSGWIPEAGSHYKTFCVDQEIVDIQEVQENRQRYDLETETHNYFANGTLVHNCNSRYIWIDRQWAGSRNEWKKKSDKNLYWRVLERNLWLGEWCESHPGIAVYGEVFGPVQDLKYGAKGNDIFFAAFDILDGGHWLDHDDAQTIGDGLQWVPLLHRGPFDEASAKELAEGDSSVPGADHLREGVVVKPVLDRRCLEIGRVQLKLVSNRYLARKSKR